MKSSFTHLPGLMLILFSFLILAVGCSESDDPVVPDGGNGLPRNTPPIPKVANFTDQLPETSETLSVEKALLGNFSPRMTDQCSILDELNNQAIALRFRMKPGYGRLIMEGAPCPPGNLQWATYNYENWSDCVLDSAPSLFDYLDSREASYYYGLNVKSYWMVLDLNSRLAGGNLVTINSAGENTFVEDIRQAWKFRQYMAIGFYDWGRTNNDFAWRSSEPVTYTSWSGSEPNNNNGEYFAMMATTGPVWNDIKGTELIYGLMESAQRLPDSEPDPVPVLLLGESPLYLGDLGDVEERPYLVRDVHWKLIFQKAIGAGATYSQVHSYKKGTEESACLSFGFSIGISTELGWGPVTSEISTEFHSDFSREITVYTEDTIEDTYECTAPGGKNVIFALWQLVEEYSIVNEAGEPWSDSKFTLDGALPSLVQGTDLEVLQTLYFNQ